MEQSPGRLTARGFRTRSTPQHLELFRSKGNLLYAYRIGKNSEPINERLPSHRSFCGVMHEKPMALGGMLDSAIGCTKIFKSGKTEAPVILWRNPERIK
jgi:hypothetical protein